MTMINNVTPSWERPRTGDIHSPDGIRAIREEAKAALIRKYAGLAESMFRWDFDDHFADMVTMSQGEVPEKWLYLNGTCCLFDLEGQIHSLPWVTEGGLNLYGQPTVWHPVPISEMYMKQHAGQNPLFDQIMSMHLDDETSVIVRNDLLSGSDKAFISSMADILVDNIVSCDQQQLMSRMPFVFNVSEDNLISAKNFFKSVCDCKPAIFTNANGEKITPITPTGVRIDTGLYEIYDRIDCLILDQLGCPSVPITKRAQQSVSEVESNSDRLFARRQEKLRQREMACDRIREIWGARASVTSVIDEQQVAEEQMQEQEDESDGADTDQ